MAGRERRGDADPDAMWKPGYVASAPDPETAFGPHAAGTARPAPVDPVRPAPVDPVLSASADDRGATVASASGASVEIDGLELYVATPSSPPRDAASLRRRRPWAVVAGVALVGALAVTGVAVLTRADAVDDGPLPHLPDDVGVRWTASVGGDVATVVSIDDLVVVASADRAATVTAFDASTGTERWAARLGRRDALGELLVVGDGVAATTTGRIPSLRVLEPATGETRWERRLRADDSVVAIGSTLALVDSVEDDLRITALDTATGDPLGSLEDPTRLGDRAFVRVDGTAVDVYDEQLRPLAADVELGEVPVDVTTVGDVLLVSGSGRLRAVELDGRERWSMPIEPGEARFLVASGAAEGQALLVSETTTTAVDVRGAEPVVRWEVDGIPVVDPSAPGTRFVPVQVGGDRELRVIDLLDGSVATRVELSAAGTVRPLYGADGVVLARAAGADTWQLEGVDYRSGSTRWATDVVGEPTLVDGGVVGVRDVEDGLDLTYVGAG